MNVILNYDDVMDFLNDKELFEEKTKAYEKERTRQILINLFKALKCNNLYEAYSLLYVHLRTSNNTRYFCLFTYYIVALYIDDFKNYNTVLKMLLDPVKFVSETKVHVYYKHFWENIKTQNLDLAKVYLGLIYELNKLVPLAKDKTKQEFETMFNALKGAKNTLNYDYDKIFRGSSTVMHKVIEFSPKHEIDVYQKTIEELYHFKITKLKKFGGAIIFPDYDEPRMKYVYECLKQDSGLSFEKIETYEGQKLIIRNRVNNKVNINELYGKYKEAKMINDYAKQKLILLDIIEHTDNPSKELYASLAYSLFKLKNIAEALKYYKIANYKYFAHTHVRPFDKVIETLKYALKEPLEYFGANSNLEQYLESFGIDAKTLREIRIYLLGKMQMEIDNALHYYNLNENQKSAVKLAIAKDFIMNGEKRMGYQILASVKEVTLQDETIKKYYDNIHENRHILELSKKNKKNKEA